MALTTLNSIQLRNILHVIEPSTTVLATIPSIESNASVETHRPCTKTCFFYAHCPFFDRPYALLGVLLSFEVLSRNPIWQGVYWDISMIKAARRSSSLSKAMHLSFLQETLARSSSRWMVVKCMEMK